MKQFTCRQPDDIAAGDSRHSAFTLVEVLLALALSLVLMGGVYMAFNNYRVFSVAGRDAAEHSQIVRAIQQKMSVDIHSVIYQPPPEEEQSEEDQAAEEGATESVQPEDVPPGDAINNSSSGVVGSANELVLQISRVPRGMNYSSSLDGKSIRDRTSDLQSVTYMLAGENQPSNLAQVIAANHGRTGLVRIMGDRFRLNEMTDDGQEASDDEISAAATILAEEVNVLQFAYYNGDTKEWEDVWDSRVSKTLPRAIKVTIGFRDPDSDNNEETTNVREFIIYLPLADPKPSTDLGF
ncbi:MAG: prepilin-type N-terminal cleavage/methylation domain-containing protein [Planctomycetes bacterium]|nr:prepilin-type N-terminal cleavage/methylation domain-containing protein [Planctomycetota bacterium]